MPKQFDEHPEAVFARLDINDLFFYRDLCKGLYQGRQQREIAEELGISEKKCQSLRKAIAEELFSNSNGSDVMEAAGGKGRGGNEKEQAAVKAFHVGLSKILDDLTRLVNDSKKGQQRVIIQGSEYSILCLLPRVLEASRFLQDNPGIVLDIRRAYWPKFLTNLQKGRVHLALGPKGRIRSDIAMIPLFKARRALIYHKAHRFACNKSGDAVDFNDISRETLFIYPGQIAWGFSLDEVLPPPREQGRRIYVDSITHMYQYVQRGLGVAFGFELKHAPHHSRGEIVTREYADHLLEPAEFYLYVLKERLGETSHAADLLRDTITRVAPTLG